MSTSPTPYRLAQLGGIGGATAKKGDRDMKHYFVFYKLDDNVAEDTIIDFEGSVFICETSGLISTDYGSGVYTVVTATDTTQARWKAEAFLRGKEREGML